MSIEFTATPSGVTALIGMVVPALRRSPVLLLTPYESRKASVFENAIPPNLPLTRTDAKKFL
jgi:hypothetical protein